MGYIIHKERKKGRYRVWGTGVDAYVATDATRDELIEFFMGREKDRITQMVDRRIEDIQACKDKETGY